MFLLCTVSPTSPLQNLFYYYILVLSTLYIRHTPSIYPYYILDICIDIPSIFIPNTYSILNTSHTLTHPVKDAQSDKEKKNVIVLTPVYINILIPPWFEGRVDDDDSFFHELNIYFPFIQAQSTWRENLHQHVHDSHLHSVTQTCQPLSGFKALDCEKLLFNV